jgi:hypothetical protein
MDELLERAVHCLAAAKGKHDILEGLYLPYMDFQKLDDLSMKIQENIRGYLPSKKSMCIIKNA